MVAVHHQTPTTIAMQFASTSLAMAQSIEKMAANSRVAGQITIVSSSDKEKEKDCWANVLLLGAFRFLCGM